jgi:LysM repeat protein
VAGIAMRYGMRPADLARLNGLANASVVLPGQNLWVPLAGAIDARSGEPAAPPVGAGAPATPDDTSRPDVTARTASAGETAYTIVPGDTLYGLADRFDVAVDDLKKWNGLPADGWLRAGDTLRVIGAPAVPPAAPAESAAPPVARAPATRDGYVVAPGDTLSSIAERHGTTADLLRSENGLYDDVIQLGQRLTVPRPGLGEAALAAPGAKRIEVVVGEQRMYVWQGDTLIWSWLVSTGITTHPTQRGTFAVQSKVPNAWSSAWQLWMPHWLGIYWAGGSENGIHALPIVNGQRLWAGNLGAPISYGCVVLGVSEANLLYNWAEIGTPVEIRD